MATTTTALTSRWMTVTDVLDRLGKLQAAREAQQRMSAQVGQQVRQREIELESSLGDLPPAQRLSVVSRATGSLRQELRRSTEAERLGFVQEAVAIGECCKSAERHYQSPMQMLMRESLGSERRSRILQQIEHSGPTELASLADYAAGTEDTELAAALCSRNASMKVAQRSFSSQELAQTLFGDQQETVAAALREVEILAREIIIEDRAFLTGRRNPTDKVSVALARRGGMRIEDGDDRRPQAEAMASSTGEE